MIICQDQVTWCSLLWCEHSFTQHCDTNTHSPSNAHSVSRLLCPRVRSYICSVRVLSWNSRRAAALREIHRWLPFYTAAVMDVCVCRAGAGDCDHHSGGWVCLCLCIAGGVTGGDPWVSQRTRRLKCLLLGGKRRFFPRLHPANLQLQTTPVNLATSLFLPPFLFPLLFFISSFHWPRNVSVSPLSCGLHSRPLSLIHALKFHSHSLTREVRLNYSHYLAGSLHTHSLCTCLSFSPFHSLFKQSRTPKCTRSPVFIVHIGKWRGGLEDKAPCCPCSRPIAEHVSPSASAGCSCF